VDVRHQRCNQSINLSVNRQVVVWNQQSINSSINQPIKQIGVCAAPALQSINQLTNQSTANAAIDRSIKLAIINQSIKLSEK
jgi:hypothetical protein